MTVPYQTARSSPELVRALLLCAENQIAAISPTGPLVHRTADLAPLVFSELLRLHREGYVGLGPRDRYDGWFPAELTECGVRLLYLHNPSSRRNTGLRNGLSALPGDPVAAAVGAGDSLER